MNWATAFIDGSGVYGNTEAELNSTRLFTGGQISEEFGKTLIPKFANPQLTILGFLFVREHNRLASSFASANPTWNDETLFQEARR